MFRQKPYRSRAFLEWAKRQHGKCCVCEDGHGIQLHHFGDKGMGQKSTDLLVCRVHEGCHRQIQGKRLIAFRRLGQLELWIRILEDSLKLLCGYVEHLEGRVPDGDPDEF